MKNIPIILLLAVSAFHVFLFMTYGSLDPCKAAAFRIAGMQSSEAGRTLGQLVVGPIETRLRAKGAITCYRAAVDENPMALLQ